MSEKTDGTTWWRKEFYSGYAIIFLLLVCVWFFSMLGPVSEALRDRQQHDLAAVARATAVALDESDLPSTELLSRVAANGDLSLALISADRRVVAESDGGANEASSRLGSEVDEALVGKEGYDCHETDEGVAYLYVAVPCEARGEGCVLRASMPEAGFSSLSSHYQKTAYALLAGALVLAATVAIYRFRRFAGPIGRLERVRTDFVANASHEMKTPVAGIQLLSESIVHASEEGDMESVRLFSQRLTHESQRLHSIINDLMDLSRLEDGRLSAMGSTSCDLSGVVATSFESRRARAEEHGLAFELDNEVAGESCRVPLSVANATLLVDNLIDNAIAYTEEGFVKVRLSVEGTRAKLEVEDSGIGIPPAEQERIFERFYRVDTTRSRETGGTGLGLSLVRHAVRRAGGSIELESELGAGSTFRVLLPLA